MSDRIGDVGASVEVGLWGLNALMREMLLFAAVGFTVGGVDDVLVDLIYLFRRLCGRGARVSLAFLPVPVTPGRFAIFVPAWDEGSLIGAMLSTALRRIDHPDYRVYVGTYPNDSGTIAAVTAIATIDPRVRLVVGPRAGPTTKGDNLNILWRALRRDQLADGQPVKAVVLHDAEDVIHPAELRVFDALLDRHAVVQLPVQPLIRSDAWLVSGTYADEFAESHGKLLVVREIIGAGLPLAGVACAIRFDALRALADRRDGDPFDAQSLTEDYEIGLHLAQLGYPACFARVVDPATNELVASRAFFPDGLAAAVRQKSRWLIGIALAGWDRLGWARPLALSDHWMRARDRRAPIAVVILVAGYLALILWSANHGVHWLAGRPTPPLGPLLLLMLELNAGLLVWRLACRIGFTTRAHGWREGARSVPRLFVGNLIAVLAVCRAITRYRRMLRGAAPVWEKTDHRFPDPIQVGG